MKTTIYCFVLCLVAMGFSMSTHQEDKLKNFKWLVGSWVMNGPNGTMMETWLPVSDSSFSGESTMRKKTTEVVNLEKVHLVSRGKDFYYIPVVSGQNDNNPVEFRITSWGKNTFIAENPAHDFPKRITYVLFKKDSLHAFIDDGISNPGKRSDYYYARVKKPAAIKPVSTKPVKKN